MVHRERGRVDAILTGIGTVLADDPLLTPRGPGVRLRRAFRRPERGGSPLRVVVDPHLRMPPGSQVVRTAREHPLLIACLASQAGVAAAHDLRAHGAAVCGFETHDGELALADLLRELAAGHDVSTVLVEAGRGLMTRLFRQRLANEAWIFTAPFEAGEQCAMGFARGFAEANAIEGCSIQRWAFQKRRGDSIARYLVIPPTRSINV
jgi:diaminohydroxyphosphoribosylaminopyrimidine deaminase/5-amino-6-(5-phosphoribosylamino)uracil reductase